MPTTPNFARLLWARPSRGQRHSRRRICRDAGAELRDSRRDPLLLAIGADLVGMSTVPEVIAARHMGLEVLAISCVTNMAAGLSGEKINHEEVLETGERVRGKFLALLRAVLPKMNALPRSHREVELLPKLGRQEALF